MRHFLCCLSGHLWAAAIAILQVSICRADTGTEVVVETSLGALRLREYGPRGAPAAIGLHGAMRQDWIHHEWDDVAAALAVHAGYNVFLPDLHASRLQAGDINPERLLTALLDVVRWAAKTGKSEQPQHKQIPLLMGKSWGGHLAGEIAALPSQPVHRLVLVAPGLSPQGPPIYCETALFCAEDDAIFPKVMEFRIRLKNEAFFQRELVGGHRVLKSYTDVMLGFVMRAQGPATGEAEPCQSQEEQEHVGSSTWGFLVLLLCIAPFLYMRFCRKSRKGEDADHAWKPSKPQPQALGVAE